MTSVRPLGTILVDAHVHLHACFEVEAFLDAAWRNLARTARRGDGGETASDLPGWTGVLLLAQTPGREPLGPFGGVDGAEATLGDWRIRRTDEPESRRLVRGDRELIVVAGSQVPTRERLEVLALGTLRTFRPGRPVRDTLAEAAGESLAVVPWGAGKWWGGRGRAVAALLDAELPFHLGDNANRPWFWPSPDLFGQARLAGRRVLPGTDTLPFPREQERAARYGFAIDGQVLSIERPMRELRGLIDDPAVELRPFGRRERTLRFAVNQAGMQRRAAARRRS